MVRLRLRRTGTVQKGSFRIVAADARSPRDGRFLEILGYYDPRHEDEKIDLERADYWLKHGAQPSPVLVDIIKRARGEAPGLKAMPKKPARKVRMAAKAAKEEAAKAAEAAKEAKAAEAAKATKAAEAAKATKAAEAAKAVEAEANK